MEHRHIPASKDGSIPSAKTRFWRGEDNFLEDVWYGRCAICAAEILAAIATRSCRPSECAIPDSGILADDQCDI